MKRYRPRAARPAKPPRPGLKSLFGQPDAAFYRLPELEIRGGSVLTDGCRRVLEFTPNASAWIWGGRLLHCMAQTWG